MRRWSHRKVLAVALSIAESVEGFDELFVECFVEYWGVFVFYARGQAVDPYF